MSQRVPESPKDPKEREFGGLPVDLLTSPVDPDLDSIATRMTLFGMALSGMMPAIARLDAERESTLDRQVTTDAKLAKIEQIAEGSRASAQKAVNMFLAVMVWRPLIAAFFGGAVVQLVWFLASRH